MAPAFWYKPHPTLPANLLRPLSYLYEKASQIHGSCRAKHAYYAAVPVISVGNLTVGGAGKTPVIQWLATHFAKQGVQVAIVSRGYGGHEAYWPTQVNPLFHNAKQVGDEPLLLAKHFAGKPVSVWVCKHRPSAVKRAEQAGNQLILLDDGFQRRDIARTVDILVINGRNPWGNGLALPAGPLRENLSARSRASFAIVLDEPIEKENTFYGLTAYRLSTQPTPQSLQALQGKPLVAFAGLAHPGKFFETLRHAGLNVQETFEFPDHHPYTRTDISFLQAAAKKHGATLVTTTKDAVKLPENMAIPLKTTLGGADSLNILEELSQRLR